MCKHQPYPWDFSPVRLLYTGVLGAASLSYYTVDLLRGRLSVTAFRERWGKTAIVDAALPLWIHASSMGEMRVAAGLAKKLKQLMPQTSVVCSASTETGYQLAREILDPMMSVFRTPVDLPGAMKSFINDVGPQALILIETEWWPNQLLACFEARIPVFVANGRVSAHSFKRYRLLRRYLRPLLQRIEHWYMKGVADAERVIALGVDCSRVEVVGSLKNVADPDKLVERTGFPAGPPVFLAGCTRPGEEELVLSAYSSARERIAALRLWLAPRHPERFQDVAALLGKSGKSWAAFSALPQQELIADDSPEIVLIDKMGVLAGLYIHAAVAFIGGSLLPYGGHNPVEPVLAGAPVLFGPFTADQTEAAEALIDSGLGRRVTDATALAAAVVDTVVRPPAFAEWNRRRRTFFSAFDQAAGRVAADILNRLTT